MTGHLTSVAERIYQCDRFLRHRNLSVTGLRVYILSPGLLQLSTMHHGESISSTAVSRQRFSDFLSHTVSAGSAGTTLNHGPRPILISDLTASVFCVINIEIVCSRP